MKEFLKKDWQERAEKSYTSEKDWFKSTVVACSSRFHCVRRYVKILEISKVLKKDDSKQKINILEPGCGIGSFSVILSIFGDVFSFDYSKEAIKIARDLFKDTKNLIFFEGDGAYPDKIPNIKIILKEKKFDFILLREFHPLTRNIIDNPAPFEIIQSYQNMLNEGGLLVIEHSLSFKEWKTCEHVLNIDKIVKYFKGLIFNTNCLDFMLYFSSILKNKNVSVIFSKMLNPIIYFHCFANKLRISK